jgi:hypothetical protein
LTYKEIKKKDPNKILSTVFTTSTGKKVVIASLNFFLLTQPVLADMLSVNQSCAGKKTKTELVGKPPDTSKPTTGVTSTEIIKKIKSGEIKTKPASAFVYKGSPEYAALLDSTDGIPGLLTIVEKYNATLSQTDTSGRNEADKIAKNLSTVVQIIKNSDVVYGMGVSGAMPTKVDSMTYWLFIRAFIAVNTNTGDGHLIILRGANPEIIDLTPELKKLMQMHGGQKITEQQIRDTARKHEGAFDMHDAIKNFYPPEQVGSSEAE